MSLTHERTESIPGSEERLLAYQQRAASHQPLFRADDRQLDSDEDGHLGCIGGSVRNGKAINSHRVGAQAGVPQERVATFVAGLPKTFAARLVVLRKRAGLRQYDVAKRVGIGLSALKNYEYGHRMPTLDVAQSLAEVLGVSLDVLAGSPGK